MKVLVALLALSALFAAVTMWKAGHNETRAAVEHPPVGQFLDVVEAGWETTIAGMRRLDPVRVHYIDEGPTSGAEDAPVVVLIHGSGGNLNDWTFDMVARLSDRYRVIAFDRPGHGYTEFDRRNVPVLDQGRLLAEAARALGADNPLIVGHSFGGAVALGWALERPDTLSGLIVLAGVSNTWDTGISRYYRTLSHPLAGPVLANLIAAWVPDNVIDTSLEAVFAPQPAQDGYGAHFGPRTTLFRRSLLENARQRASLLPQVEAMVPRYPSINVPTEIIHGDADTTVSMAIHAIPLSQQITDAHLTVLPGVGHMPQHADPQALVDAIDRVSARAGLR